jgi:hypothetical protein
LTHSAAETGSYVLGIMVNTCTSILLAPVDDNMREGVLNSQVQQELGELDPWIKGQQGKTSDIYHYMRYRLYGQGATVKAQLDQHYSEIRILRATAFNSYWLMMVVLLLLFPDPAGARQTLHRAIVGGLWGIIALLLLWGLSVLQPPFLTRWKEARPKKVSCLYTSVFWCMLLIPWLVAMPRGLGYVEGMGGALTGALAVGALLLWGKQQQRFYQALIHGFRALTVQRQPGA